jgi:hypothetical protein
MNKITRNFISELNANIEEIEVLNNIARDSQLQREACKQLIGIAGRVAELKLEAIQNSDEDAANLLLGFECVIEFLKSEITMWLFLKSDQPDEAWRHLVDAQRAAGDAVRSHQGFQHLRAHVERLHQVEKLVFPPQVFTSIGIVVRCRRCSICGEEYGECAHLVGIPYMGRICHTIITELERVDHVAIVTEPANKNCRITSFSVPGGVGKHQDLGGVTRRQPERWRRCCRWPALGTIVRTLAEACHRGCVCGSVGAGGHRAWSTASAGVWRSAC